LVTASAPAGETAPALAENAPSEYIIAPAQRASPPPATFLLAGEVSKPGAAKRAEAEPPVPAQLQATESDADPRPREPGPLKPEPSEATDPDKQLIEAVIARYGADQGKIDKACAGGDMEACYVAGLRREGKPASIAYLRKACAARVGYGCLHVALSMIPPSAIKHMSDYRKLGVSVRREIFALMSEQCHQTPRFSICSELGEYAVEPGDITGMVPLSVGGVRLGATSAQVRKACLGAGGQYRGITAGAICTTAPINPFPVAAQLLVFFCGQRACEIIFEFAPMGVIEANSVVYVLVKRYGEPSDSEQASACRTPSQGTFSDYWFDQQNAGYIKANYNCSPGDDTPSLSLFYTNRAGMRRRMREHLEKKLNY